MHRAAQGLICSLTTARKVIGSATAIILSKDPPQFAQEQQGQIQDSQREGRKRGPKEVKGCGFNRLRGQVILELGSL